MVEVDGVGLENVAATGCRGVDVFLSILALSGASW